MKQNLPNLITKGKVAWFVSYFQLENGITRIDGPLCLKKDCTTTLIHSVLNYWHCPKCKKAYEMERDADVVKREVRAIAEGLVRKRFITSRLDGDIEYVNTEQADMGDKWLDVRVSVENGEQGDAHIFIGDKRSEGRKTHIIVAPSGDVRTDPTDLEPAENVKEIEVLIENESGTKKRKTKYTR